MSSELYCEAKRHLHVASPPASCEICRWKDKCVIYGRLEQARTILPESCEKCKDYGVKAMTLLAFNALRKIVEDEPDIYSLNDVKVHYCEQEHKLLVNQIGVNLELSEQIKGLEARLNRIQEHKQELEYVRLWISQFDRKVAGANRCLLNLDVVLEQLRKETTP